MMFIKYILLFMIFGISMYIGKLLSMKYVLRVRELEDFKNALNIFKAKIKFTYEPLSEIFKEIEENINHNVSKLFKNAEEKMKVELASNAWIEATDEYNGNLKEEDKLILKNLSKMLR